MIVSLVYAQSENGVIGSNNQLPWHLPADLRHFKNLTIGHTIIMGRKTYESIGRPLPNRRTVVVSRRGYHANGVHAYPSLEEALESCTDEDEVFVIGGAELFRAALPIADRVYRTIVHARIAGDVVMSELDDAVWTLVDSKGLQASDTDDLRLSFQRFVRRSV